MDVIDVKAVPRDRRYRMYSHMSVEQAAAAFDLAMGRLPEIIYRLRVGTKWEVLAIEASVVEIREEIIACNGGLQ
jgi:hypothetical protein